MEFVTSASSEDPPICDITPFTMQDFPDHTACILWFSGCNFRCDYCQNPELVVGKQVRKNINEIWKFLQSRVGLLDGVVLSGGECTMYNGLEEFAQKLRLLNFKIKLDTNGSNPEIVQRLCEKKLVDYVALDYKAPIGSFVRITKYSKQIQFFRTLNYLCSNDTYFEVRTTIHTALLNEGHVAEIIHDLDSRNFQGILYLQNFNAVKTLSPLPKQQRMLDLSLLPNPKYFTIKTRNWN